MTYVRQGSRTEDDHPPKPPAYHPSGSSCPSCPTRPVSSHGRGGGWCYRVGGWSAGGPGGWSFRQELNLGGWWRVVFPYYK
jgi:hypothetical protein